MRFLIFNMVVFLSIGYLFTAAPGQSVGNWLDATIDMVSRTVASATSTAASKQILAPEDKLVQPAVSAPAPVTEHNDDIKITADKIQKIISDSVNNCWRKLPLAVAVFKLIKWHHCRVQPLPLPHQLTRRTIAN